MNWFPTEFNEELMNHSLLTFFFSATELCSTPCWVWNCLISPKSENKTVNSRREFCRNCFYVQSDEEVFTRQKELCYDYNAARINISNGNNAFLSFKSFHIRYFAPVVLYFDKNLCFWYLTMYRMNPMIVALTQLKDVSPDCMSDFVKTNRKTKQKFWGKTSITRNNSPGI